MIFLLSSNKIAQLQHDVFSGRFCSRQYSWNDVFGTIFPESPQPQVLSERFNSNTLENVYIHNSIFKDINSNEKKGGAIFFNIYNWASNIAFLVENSQFINCTATEQGGGIYIHNVENCALIKVCGYGCKSGKYSFSYIHISDSFVNKIEYSTVSQCDPNSESAMYISNGMINLNFFNSSQNKFKGNSVIELTTKSQGSFDQSLIADNADTKWCITLNGVNAFYTISFCNIFRNEVGDTEECGILNVKDAQTRLAGTCVMDNKGKFLFHVGRENIITIDNCTIQDGAQINKGMLIITNIPEAPFTNDIKRDGIKICENKVENPITPNPYDSSPYFIYRLTVPILTMLTIK